MTPSYTPPQLQLPGIRDPRRDYPFENLPVQCGTAPSNRQHVHPEALRSPPGYVVPAGQPPGSHRAAWRRRDKWKTTPRSHGQSSPSHPLNSPESSRNQRSPFPSAIHKRCGCHVGWNPERHLPPVLALPVPGIRLGCRRTSRVLIASPFHFRSISRVPQRPPCEAASDPRDAGEISRFV
jgi:hypothetical protein